MTLTGFDSVVDGLTSHYIIAVIVSLLAMIAAFVSVRIDVGAREAVPGSPPHPVRNDPDSSDDSESGDDEAIEQVDEEEMKKNLKKSPAVIAEEVIKASMTEEQKQLEQEVKRKQLNEIFKLMQQEREKFGDISVEQVEEQMKLYQ